MNARPLTPTLSPSTGSGQASGEEGVGFPPPLRGRARVGGVTQAAPQEDVQLRHACRTAPAPAPPPLSWQEMRKRAAFMRSAAILAAIRCGLEARTPCLRAGTGLSFRQKRGGGFQTDTPPLRVSTCNRPDHVKDWALSVFSQWGDSNEYASGCCPARPTN